MDSLLPSDPATVGEFRLQGRLGAGGMGQVYLGVTQSGRPVAVKVIRADIAADPAFRERFAREVAAARQVGGFWTASVVAADPDAPMPWLATEYVAGPSLHQAVASSGPLPSDTARALAARLAEALAAIHGARLVHRDLKPANVLLAATGPVVIDFGISRSFHTETAAFTAAIGTPVYMAPELLHGHPPQPASDMYALGATLVYALCGRGPFAADTPASAVYQIETQPPDLTGVPAELYGLVAACLDKDPARRPTTGQMLAELGPAAGSVLTPYGDWRAPTSGAGAALPTPPPAPAAPDWPPPPTAPAYPLSPPAAGPIAPPWPPGPVPPAPAAGPPGWPGWPGYPPALAGTPGPGYPPLPPAAPWPGPAGPAPARPALVVVAMITLGIAVATLLAASGLVPPWWQLAASSLEGTSLSPDTQRDELNGSVVPHAWVMVFTLPAALMLVAMAIGVGKGRPGARTLVLSLGAVLTTVLVAVSLFAVLHVVFALEQADSSRVTGRTEMYRATQGFVVSYAVATVTATVMSLLSVILLALPPAGRYFHSRRRLH